IGSVALAYDPELDRRVALKILRPEVWNLVGTEARERLQREAMVMARLAHPNIVTVYDVGTWCDQAYIAMEYVDGPTLLEWREAAPRTWREVLEVCLAAGRGIAAAHASGIIHRDVKPPNVLLGQDGRVRVTDFGVAALIDEMRGAAGAEELISGTPGYMSPEQMEGRPTDERSDQFGFCVTVWEAMSGQRPFQGDTLPSIWNAVRTRAIAEPQPARLPAPIRRVLLRGLSPDPAQRYASMDELLAALAAPARVRRRVVLASAAAAGLAAAVGIGALAGHKDSAAPCSGAVEHVSRVWDPARRGAVQEVFLSAGLRDPGASFARFARALDERTDSWSSARTQACRATRVLGEQSEPVLEARLDCLDDQLRSLDSLVAAVRTGEVSTFEALDAVHALPDADACSAAAARARGTPATFASDPAAAQRAAAVDRALARARVAISMVDLEAAREATADAEQAMADLPDEVRRARVLYERGRTAEVADDFDEAERAFTSAAQTAARARADQVVAETAVHMVFVLGVDQQKVAEAAPWDASAELLLARGVGDDALRALLEEARGKMAFHAHEMDAARRHAERALELHRRANGNRGPGRIGALRLKASVLDATGDREGAHALYTEALALAERNYGPDHPQVANVLTMLARWSTESGDFSGARTGFERALAIRERALGPEHPLVAESLGDLGIVLDELGDAAGAEANLRRWLAVEEKTDPNGQNMAAPLVNLGVVLRKGGRNDEARPLIQRAISLYESVRGAEFPGLVAPLLELAFVELASEDGCKTAEPILQRALRIAEKNPAPDDPTASYLLIPLATCEAAAGREKRALELARRAVHLRESAKMPPELVAEARFAEAGALWAAGHKDDARRLADLARRDASAELAVEIDQWLRQPARGPRRHRL
ncbi:MAG TPA: serine/threonine-protein kinase, partial [Kofleriaceae bacterium]|nr:serine/threonine-protein kinase [Kofleriaceae bacterium]